MSTESNVSGIEEVCRCTNQTALLFFVSFFTQWVQSTQLRTS